MPASATVPLSEYLETVYRPDCEYLDGELLERNVGEWDHSRLQASLTGYLFAREKHYGIVVATEQRVQVKATRFRVPDILVLIGRRPQARSSTNRLFSASKFSPPVINLHRCKTESTIICASE